MLTALLGGLLNKMDGQGGESQLTPAENLIDMLAQNQLRGNPLQQTTMFTKKECPDPYGVHGSGIMMNKTSMYGQPMWLCPSCAYREPAEG